MTSQFVMEAIMLAVHHRLYATSHPVKYLVPFTTIEELYEVIDLKEHILSNTDDDVHVKKRIGELILYFESSFNRKKLERALMQPWKKSLPIIIDENVIITVIYALDNEEFGDAFDPIETELILTAQKEQIPLLTDQLELIEKIRNHHIPIEVYDIEDFEKIVSSHFK